MPRAPWPGAYSRYWEPYLTISVIYWMLTLALTLAWCGGWRIGMGEAIRVEALTKRFGRLEVLRGIDCARARSRRWCA